MYVRTLFGMYAIAWISLDKRTVDRKTVALIFARPLAVGATRDKRLAKWWSHFGMDDRAFLLISTLSLWFATYHIRALISACAFSVHVQVWYNAFTQSLSERKDSISSAHIFADRMDLAASMRGTKKSPRVTGEEVPIEI